LRIFIFKHYINSLFQLRNNIRTICFGFITILEVFSRSTPYVIL
jgi:hypothetical protein